MDGWLVQGATCFLPIESWDKLQSSHYSEQEKAGKKMGWSMDGAQSEQTMFLKSSTSIFKHSLNTVYVTSLDIPEYSMPQLWYVSQNHRLSPRESKFGKRHALKKKKTYQAIRFSKKW